LVFNDIEGEVLIHEILHAFSFTQMHLTTQQQKQPFSIFRYHLMILQLKKNNFFFTFIWKAHIKKVSKYINVTEYFYFK